MRVSFRRVERKDLRRLNGIVNDPEVSHFIDLTPPVSMKSTREFYEHCRKEKTAWYCIIVDGALAGSVSLHPHRKNTKRAHAAAIGINVAKEYWGRGVGDAGMRFILGEAGRLGIKRVELFVVEDNVRARRLYEKHGFVREGLNKKSFKINGRYHNTLMMARFLK